MEVLKYQIHTDSRMVVARGFRELQVQSLFCKMKRVLEMDGCDDCTTTWMYVISLKWFNGEANGTPLQYSCLENPMDGGAWRAAVHEVAKSRTRLSDFTFTFHFHPLEKEMATHSSVLAWRIPGTEEPGWRPSVGSHRVGCDWSDLAAAAVAEWGPIIYISISS